VYATDYTDYTDSEQCNRQLSKMNRSEFNNVPIPPICANLCTLQGQSVQSV